YAVPDGRHAQHAEEGPELDFEAVRAAAPVRQLPPQHVPGVAEGDAPRAGNDLVDPDRECLALDGATHQYRPGQRVPFVQMRVAGLEQLARGEIPAGVRRRDMHRVAGIELEHGLEVAREVAVKGAPLERDL